MALVVCEPLRLSREIPKNEADVPRPPRAISVRKPAQAGAKGGRQFHTGTGLYTGFEDRRGFFYRRLTIVRDAASLCSQVVCKSGFFNARKKEGVTAPHDKPRKRPASAIVLKATIFGGLSPVFLRTLKYLFRSLVTKSA